MNKKNIFIFIILFCWFVLLPIVCYIFSPLPSIQISTYLSWSSTLYRAYSLSLIVGFVIFLFSFIHSLIKLINYKNDSEKKLIYRKNLIRYSIFLLIILLSWYINRWIGQNTGIEIGDGLISYR